MPPVVPAWLGVEIADGVVSLAARVGHAYLVDAGDGPVVVDTGMRGSARGVLRSIEAAGLRPADLRTIVLTHCDLDHVGSADALRRATGAAVAGHELDAPVLRGDTPPQKGGRVMAALFRLTGFRPFAPTSCCAMATRWAGHGAPAWTADTEEK